MSPPAIASPLKGMFQQSFFVEGNVPAKFFPKRFFKRSFRFGGKPGGAEHFRERARAFPRRAAVALAQPKPRRAEIFDDAGREAVNRDVAQAADDVLRAEKRAEHLDVAQPVLQREQRRSRADERRKQLRKLRVRRRFQRDQHEVARADFLRASVREHGNDGRFPAVADFEAAAFPHGIVVAAQKEVRLMPRLREAYSVIGADGARSDNRNFHHARKLFF